MPVASYVVNGDNTIEATVPVLVTVIALVELSVNGIAVKGNSATVFAVVVNADVDGVKLPV